MQLFSKLKGYFSRHYSRPRKRESDAEQAYDLWSLQYDRQPDNLMLALDEALFADLIKDIAIEGRTVADIGCGTGRHWGKIMEKLPEKLIGFDVSRGMLARLTQKFPDAVTQQVTDHRLAAFPDQSCHVVISTLAIAHIENIEAGFSEWDRVLRDGGDILITDYHPAALAKGGDRTFMHDDKLISIKNHVHSIETLNRLARQLQWQIIRFSEKRIDETVRHYYEKQNAVAIFEQFRGTPIIYGMHLKKGNAAS